MRHFFIFVETPNLGVSTKKRILCPQLQSIGQNNLFSDPYLTGFGSVCKTELYSKTPERLQISLNDPVNIGLLLTNALFMFIS